MLNPQQQFEQELRNELEAIEFPAEAIPVHFKGWLFDALKNESMASIQCDYNTLVKLHETADPTVVLLPINMFVMGSAINAIEKQPYKTYGRGDGFGDSYLHIIGHACTMGQKWNEIVRPIQGKIQRKIEALAKAPSQQQPKRIISVR